MKQSSCCQHPSSLFLSNTYGQLPQPGCQAGLCKSREPFPLPVEFHSMVLCFPSPLRKLCFKSRAACRGLLELVGGTAGSHSLFRAWIDCCRTHRTILWRKGKGAAQQRWNKDVISVRKGKVL